MTQSDLGKVVGTSGDIIGKYERDEIKPSIDTAAKIANALNVTIDYLVKDAEYQNIDNETLKRMKRGWKSSRKKIKGMCLQCSMLFLPKQNCKVSCNKKPRIPRL